MTTNTWDNTANDWCNNNGADWSPAVDPAATDDVISSGGVELNSGDSGFTIASLSNSGALQIADPGAMQMVPGGVAKHSGAFDVGTVSFHDGSIVAARGKPTINYRRDL